ncbi:5252_t:CDS:2 [Rhizophagus irregularis]|nr:5252_t:CDS:2 [Rhizophagus irregularis]
MAENSKNSLKIFSSENGIKTYLGGELSVDREQKRLKVVSFKMVLEEFDKNILVNKSQKLYPGFTVNIVGHFSKDKMPISCLNYVDMQQRHDCYEYMECKPPDTTKIDPTKDQISFFTFILLKKKFPDISSCDYPLAQINGGQEIISGVGYVSKSEINDDSAIFVDCGITSLKSDDENKKFWMVKEPLAI